MKISVIGPVYPYRGGIAHFTTSLCRELAEAGHQVQTVSFKRQYPAWLYPGQSDKDPSLLHEQVPAQYALDPFSFWTWWQAARQVTDFAPDLVIIQWWTTFWAPAFYVLSAVLNRRRIPCVFCIHNVIPHENRLPDIWLARKVLSQGKAFITLSPKETGRLQSLLPSANVFQSQLPVPKVAQVSVDRQSIRKELGILPNQTVLLFFGIVRPYKGLNILIDALGVLAKKNIRPFLIVAGEFWEDINKYKKQVEQLSLKEQILLENRYIPNEEIGKYFTVADALAAPYVQGTQSAAIKMGMGYHLPVLASDQISSDLFIDNYSTFLHRAGDVEDLARSIQKFVCGDFSGVQKRDNHNNSHDLLVVIKQLGMLLQSKLDSTTEILDEQDGTR